MVLADVPGLLEGAHEGVGLGIEFLRHIERTRVLVHVVAGDSPDPLGDFEAINLELSLFNPTLMEKPQLVALNKMDLPQSQEAWPAFKDAVESQGYPVISISAATTKNVQELLYRVQEMLDALPPEIPDVVEDDELPEIVPPPDENEFRIFPAGDDEWRVEGVAIERIAQMTNWEYYESGLRFQRILRAMGIADALRKEGVQEGDVVHFGEVELVWGYENALEE
jgi:GTPase